jgi:DNA-binding NarL/FixJ family response regulator
VRIADPQVWQLCETGEVSLTGTVRARIHNGLRGIINESQEPFDDLDVLFEFVDPQSLPQPSSDPWPIFVPVTNEFQAEFVHTIRQSACMTPIIAIVNDVNGYQTYMAIKYGATCVFNIMVPADKQADSLRSVLFSAGQPALSRVPQPRAGRPAAPVPGKRPRDLVADLDQQERALLKLLCGNETMSVIAKSFYCSERSIYRRVRQLYDRFEVPGRTELRMALAESTHRVHAAA